LLADACELTSLQEAELQICDVVIAATGDDKSNLTMSLLAKTEFGVGRVVARVNDFRNEWLFTMPGASTSPCPLRLPWSPRSRGRSTSAIWCG
jgi:Trk K+ transport system NAD-binding subunit